jgi:hypothetical protein
MGQAYSIMKRGLMTNKSTIRIIAMVFCLFAAPQVFGQGSVSQQKKALIKELLGLMNATANAETLKQILQQQLREPVASLFAQGLRQFLATENLTPDERKRAEARVNERAERVVDRIQVEISKRINFSELLELVWTGIYDKHFTEDELKELVAFHKSAVVQKFFKLGPQLMNEATPKTQELIVPIITQVIAEIVEEEKKLIIAK